MTKKSSLKLLRNTEAVIAFHLLYEKCINIMGSCGKAYDLAENIHKKRYGKRFYKNYVSFRTARVHYLKNIKK